MGKKNIFTDSVPFKINEILKFLKARHLKTETMTYEDKEHQLVTDCVKEISEYSDHVFHRE